MGYDRFGRCAVCGRREGEDCNKRTHEVHDKLQDDPLWVTANYPSKKGRIVPSKDRRKQIEMLRRHNA